MKKFNTVFLTTIFPKSEKYLDDFFLSLENQNYNDFDVLVMNDGVEGFGNYKLKYAGLNIIEKRVSELPVKNREKGIREVLNLGYKYIIFGDSDDYFSKNRIKKSIEYLQKYDLVVNELIVFSKKFKENNFLKRHIKNLNRIEDIIFEGNIFGFSNVALRTEIILKEPNFDNNLIAVDWFFMTSLIIQNDYRIKYLEDVNTYYRQYDNNTIGLSLQLAEEKLKLGIKVKEAHYSSLIKYCKNHALINYKKIFKNKLRQILILKEKLEKESFKKKYLKIINSNINEIFMGWWSEIISLETYFKYENKNK